MFLEALLYAVLGGAAFGTYPLFIRTKAVLDAKPHPIVFQLYKSSVVFLTGFLWLIPRYFRWRDHHQDGEQLFVFNSWAVASAALWIPSGLATIWSVPIIGMGLQVAIAASASSVVSFLTFWLLFGTRMREHSCGDNCVYYLAPLYLFFTVSGMVCLVFSGQVAQCLRQRCCFSGTCTRRRKDREGRDTTNAYFAAASTEEEQQQKVVVTDELLDPMADESSTDSTGSLRAADVVKWGLGIGISMMGGISASGEFAVIQQGKKIEETSAGCAASNVTCPPALIEAWDTFGSWYVSFGIGALGVTLVLFLIVSCFRGSMLPLHWSVLRVAGVKAGLFWVVGNFGTTLAVVRGGNAVVLSQSLSAMIITSGLWGLVYYKEGDLSLLRRSVWFASAVFTVISMILLGTEKLSS